jgi:hypothetical protein
MEAQKQLFEEHVRIEDWETCAKTVNDKREEQPKTIMTGKGRVGMASLTAV